MGEKEVIERLEATLLQKIGATAALSELELLRVATLGKKGSVSEKLKTLGRCSLEERKILGPLLNGLKLRLQEAFDQKRNRLHAQEIARRLESERLDMTLPVRLGPLAEGRIHPVSQVMDEVIAFFAQMGFSVAEGPDIETDYHNFTALNFPQDHPARAMHDTFFFSPKEDGVQLLLRTHTSPVQIHTMQAQKPPIRIIIPGRTYRCDSDQTHTPMFHQVEGLVVDRSSHIGHLKWILKEFCRAFFGLETVKMRFRPSFFPFTEPSMEVDIGCHFKEGEVQIGRGENWMEILGCGMVHPAVLRNCGLDPDLYQGFAWGMGIDRLAMLKYGMADLRSFFESDIRWLKHYGFRLFEAPALAL